MLKPFFIPASALPHWVCCQNVYDVQADFGQKLNVELTKNIRLLVVCLAGKVGE
jgi:hypothetical protein